MNRLFHLGTALSSLLFVSTAAFGQDGVQGTTTTLPVATPATEQAEVTSVSQVRIVRLSQIRGKVEMERAASLGFNATFTNLPVVQGARLQSYEGVAEVEFEDNSTLRISPSSSIEFTELGRNDVGSTVNKIRLVTGTLYVSLLNTKGIDFEVKVGDQSITLAPSAHIRLDVYPSGSELTVFHGKAGVSTDGTVTLVGSGKVFRLSSAGSVQATSARNEEPGLYDSWDQQEKEQHDVRVGNSFAGAAYSYGRSDLNYYGSFQNVGGCGQVWQPYFVNSAWDPYASGTWAYYPGAGYSWVSPYPWGWAPFHSGNWVNCPGTGWGWQPGQTWNGLQNVSKLHLGHRPAPPRPPLAGQPGLVGVNLSTLRPSHPVAGDKYEFARNSAGLGVPRDLGINLRKSSQAVLTRDVAQTRVDYADVLQQTVRSTVSPSSINRPGDGRSAAMDRPVSRPVAVRSSESSAGSFGGGSRAGSTGSSSSSSRSSMGSVNTSSASIGRASAPSTSSAPASSSSPAGSRH